MVSSCFEHWTLFHTPLMLSQRWRPLPRANIAELHLGGAPPGRRPVGAAAGRPLDTAGEAARRRPRLAPPPSAPLAGQPLQDPSLSSSCAASSPSRSGLSHVGASRMGWGSRSQGTMGNFIGFPTPAYPTGPQSTRPKRKNAIPTSLNIPLCEGSRRPLYSSTAEVFATEAGLRFQLIRRPSLRLWAGTAVRHKP